MKKINYVFLALLVSTNVMAMDGGASGSMGGGAGSNSGMGTTGGSATSSGSFGAVKSTPDNRNIGTQNNPKNGNATGTLNGANPGLPNSNQYGY